MICKSCGGEMSPVKDIVSVSGTGTHCVPCWSCIDCDEIKYVKSELELDIWVSKYTVDGDYSPDAIEELEEVASSEDEDQIEEDLEDLDFYNSNFIDQEEDTDSDDEDY